MMRKQAETNISAPTGLSYSEVAGRVGVSERTVRNWVREGRLAARQLSPRVHRIDEQELSQFWQSAPLVGVA